jgi:hypothetical protein
MSDSDQPRQNENNNNNGRPTENLGKKENVFPLEGRRPKETNVRKSSGDVAVVVEKKEREIKASDPNAVLEDLQGKIRGSYIYNAKNELWYYHHDFNPHIVSPLDGKEFRMLLWGEYEEAAKKYNKSISEAAFKALIKTLGLKNSVFIKPPTGAYVALRDGWQINLKTGRLDGQVTEFTDFFLPIDSEDWVNYSYDTPKWDAFLKEHTSEEDAIIAEQFIGYILSASSVRDMACMLILFGPHDTGKTQFIEFLRTLIPPYCASATVQDCISNPLIAASIVGKRLVTSSEAVIKAKDAAKFRSLISGEDLHIKNLFLNEIRVNHNAVFVAAMNDIGWLEANSQNLKRIRAVYWGNTIPQEKMRPNFFKELAEESDGIIIKCLKRFIALQGKRIKISNTTRTYMEQAGRNMNPVSDWVFISDLKQGEHFVSTAKLWKAFTEETGTRMNLLEFGRKLVAALGESARERKTIKGVEVRGFSLNKSASKFGGQL